MDLDLLFQQYYSQYRVEAQIPASTDDEYVIFTSLANEAINRWANYDNTFWKELYMTNQLDGSGDTVLAANTTEYAAPTNMRIAGGYIRVYNSLGTTIKRIPIIEPQEAQWQSDVASYAYFIGNPNSGFNLNINPVPQPTEVGLSFDYVYYKTPSLLATGADTPEMSQPYFIVHRALANRFRGSRNPYYAAAKNDAEDVLKTMQMENNSGNWADPWKLADHTGGNFGQETGSGGFFGVH